MEPTGLRGVNQSKWTWMMTQMTRTLRLRGLPVLAVSLLLMGGLMPLASAISPGAYAQYQQAVGLEKTRDFKGAEQAYRTAIGLDPYDALCYIRLADLMARDGRRDEALTLYQQAINLNPQDPMVHLSVGQLLELKNQTAQALDHYKKVAVLNPDYAYIQLAIARTEKELGHQALAVTAYQTFLKAYPQHFDAQRELAALLLKSQQFETAAETFESMKTQHPEKFHDDLAYAVALNNADRPAEALTALKKVTTPSVTLYEQMGMAYEKLNKLPEAITAYQSAISLAPKDKYNLYLKIADLSASQNKDDATANALVAYLTHEPKNARVQSSLAQVYVRKKRYAEAVSTLNAAMANAPSDDLVFRTGVLENLGYAYQMSGNQAAAIDTYQKALQLKQNPQTELNLALAYHQQGKLEEALALYRRLLVSNPTSENLRKDTGQVLLALGDRAFEAQNHVEALQYYQDALLLGNQQEVPALLGIANTQYAQNNLDLAYMSYQRILDKAPENVTARLNKAKIDLGRRAWMPAVENLRWVAQNVPDNADAHRMLAQTYETLGDFGQAILSYQNALSLRPRETGLLLGYGNVWRQVGDLDRAEKAYRLVLEANPTHAVAHYNLGSIYNLKGQLPESVKAYQTALELNPALNDAWFGLATTQEKQKQWQQAVDSYQQFIKKSPGPSAYVSTAKDRVVLLNKVINPPKTPVVPVKTTPKASTPKALPTVTLPKTPAKVTAPVAAKPVVKASAVAKPSAQPVKKP